MLLHTFKNILVKKLFGNDLVGRFSCFPYYKDRLKGFRKTGNQSYREVVRDKLNVNKYQQEG